MNECVEQRSKYPVFDATNSGYILQGVLFITLSIIIIFNTQNPVIRGKRNHISINDRTGSFENLKNLPPSNCSRYSHKAVLTPD